MADRVFFEFDPFEKFPDVTVPKSVKSEAAQEVADFVKERVLSYVGEGTSPVSGYGKFAPLSPGYREAKKKVSSNAIPNMELTGAMLDALNCRPSKGKIVLEVKGPEAQKAEGHNQHREGSFLPLRRFIPYGRDEETFKKDIWDGVREILQGYAEEGE